VKLTYIKCINNYKNMRIS